MQENSPDWLLKRITPAEAGARRSCAGIEERAPRIFVPKWWRYVSAFRGMLNPLLDRRMEQRPEGRRAGPRPRREERRRPATKTPAASP